MKVTRISPLTHRETTLELDVTPCWGSTNDRPPTPLEMRRVAYYLAVELRQYSAAGKLIDRAERLEKMIEQTKEEED